MAPKDRSFEVRPAKGDYSWWGVPAAEVTGVRVCQFDDIYNFGADGTFKMYWELKLILKHGKVEMVAVHQ